MSCYVISSYKIQNFQYLLFSVYTNNTTIEVGSFFHGFLDLSLLYQSKVLYLDVKFGTLEVKDLTLEFISQQFYCVIYRS